VKIETMAIAGAYLCFVAATASAQTTNEVRVSVELVSYAARGSETVSSRLTVGLPGSARAAAVGVLSASTCQDLIGPRGPAGTDVPNDAIDAWRVELIPLTAKPSRIPGHVWTFKLRWTRVVTDGKPSSVGNDVELTLAPGQSRMVETVPVGPAFGLTQARQPCSTLFESVGLRLSSSYALDDRLFAFDVWLVERRADGQERSQLQAVRGRVNEPIPFYFDRLDTNVDVSGKITIDPYHEEWLVSVSTTRVLATGGQRTGIMGEGPAVPLKPDEVVEIPLTAVSGVQVLPELQNLALRIRGRQLR
jgi:hypothetical protein